mmetsp:Transcript_61271/g.144744  ORF Transcript_61271/g.144744 Transcript_61271/m.144744 type:complete len:133 (-) Transcript_61271:54-452(-)
MLMFDLSERATLEEAGLYLKEVRENVDEDTPIVLIGNKTDKHRVISREEAEEFAAKEGLHYFEMSVKKDENVDETVAEVLRLGAESAFPDLQDWAAAEVDLGQRNDQDTIQRIYSPGAHGPNLLCKSAAKVA